MTGFFKIFNHPSLQDSWRLILHQTLVFVLVIGRWILPKGKITDAELSQLLLVMIAIAADIVEFITETVDTESLTQVCNSSIHYCLWMVWLWALMQFVLNMVASQDVKIKTFTALSKNMRHSLYGAPSRNLSLQKTRLQVGQDSDSDSNNDNDLVRKARAFKRKESFFTSLLSCYGLLNNPDLFGIFITLFFQDGPFLICRIYLISHYNMWQNNDGSLNQMVIFFTGKNFLVILLQIYRFFMICLDKNQKTKTDIKDLQVKILRNTGGVDFLAVFLR